MADPARFIADCVASGAIFYSTCSLLIVPFAAWLGVRAVVPIVRRMDGDPQWQASLAAASLLVPAVLLVIMVVTAIAAGFFAVCTRTYTGRVVFALFVAAVSIRFVRAIQQSMSRRRDTRALLAVTAAPSPKLRVVAEQLGLTVRELDDMRPFCALVGARSPQIVVSRGTVMQLSGDELRAALLHERGHARRGDHLIAALLAFSVDVLPLPSRELIALYREARESAADRHALHSAKPEDLAGALLTFTRTRSSFIHLASLYGEHGVSKRLRWLLDDAAVARASPASRFTVAAALAVIFIAGLRPVEAAVRSFSAPHVAPLRATTSLKRTPLIDRGALSANVGCAAAR
jgi:Zn-dependent protease with chaperone function